MFIVKRDGRHVEFDQSKIYKAICGANSEITVEKQKLSEAQIAEIVQRVVHKIVSNPKQWHVEEIQDVVELEVCKVNPRVGKHYIVYRYQHGLDREENVMNKKILSILNNSNIEVKEENSNKDTTIASVQRDYIAGEWCRNYTNSTLLPKDIKDANDRGLIHFHDADFYPQRLHNCDVFNLDDMLQNGTAISGVGIDKPHSFSTACTIASQIVSQVASSQYGGQTFTLSHLVDFVEITRKSIRRRLEPIVGDDVLLNKIIERETLQDIEKGCQTIQYQLITIQTTNGQSPFVSIFMNIKEVPENKRNDLAMIIETMLRQRILGVKDIHGNYITPAFPKLLYCLTDINTYAGQKYFYLTQLAAECSVKRLTPDYISEKKMLELKGDVYPCMGCRSFLTPDRFTDKGLGNIANAKNYVQDKHKYYGRFNLGVVTINLAYVAMMGDKKDFDKNLEDILELCHRALQLRIKHLKGTVSDIAPILWQNGALARLKPGETIDKLFYNGYATISLGYAGLYECVEHLCGKSHTTEEGRELAKSVMQRLNDKCAAWKAEENIDYSVYGTPLESTTQKFANALKRDFGFKYDYITNSYHINVREKIDAFEKLKQEAEFQKLSPGGAISYIECPGMDNNIEAVIEIIQFIYETIIYAELNFKIDLCEKCGFTGEIKVVKDDIGRLVWECPNCGNRDEKMMHVARRTCGYIGTQYWNQGRTAEIKDRVEHLDIEEE